MHSELVLNNLHKIINKQMEIINIKWIVNWYWIIVENHQ